MVLNQTQKSILSSYLMVELHDKYHQNHMHFAAFDDTGEFVMLKFSNNRTISTHIPISREDIKHMGFKIMSKSKNEEKGYLRDKGFQINEHCNCLSHIDQQVSHKTGCSHNKKEDECISPKKIISFAFPLEEMEFAHEREKIESIDDDED